MTRDELEFQISQYLDGTLALAERDALEDRLGSDADARALLAEYRDVDAVLKASVSALPDVRWDRLADYLSHAVAAAEIDEQQQQPAAPARGRSARSYRLADWLRAPLAPLAAIAASVLIVAGIGLALRNPGGTTQMGRIEDPPLPPAQPIVMVKISPEYRPLQPAGGEPEVAVGPSRTVADSPALARYDLLDRPRRASIASGVTPLPDRSGIIPN